MLKNYFKTAFRNFWRHKLFTLINMVGLSIGISAAVVIYLIVHYDFTFDKYHKDGDRIYRVVTSYSFQGEPGYNSGVPTPVGSTVKKEVAGIELSAPFFCMYETKVIVGSETQSPRMVKNDGNFICADERYFDMFRYHWLVGSPKLSLKEPFQVVLTTDQAKKYFPALSYDQMIGRRLVYDDSIKTTVSGIVEPLKGNTDFTFHEFLSYSTGLTSNQLKDNFQMAWNNINSQSQLFVKLAPNADTARVHAGLNVMFKKYDPPKSKSSTEELHLEKLSDLHFDTVYSSFDNVRVADKKTLYALLVIAGFLLLLGCINFINLTTAQASQRAKEIGIRKTLGSNRKQLIFQFLSETFLITLMAVILSSVITPVLLSLFKDFIPSQLSFNIIHQPDVILFLLMLTTVVSLLSGTYPALILSGYKPINVLKGQLQDSNKTRNAWLRKSLTVTQFVVALFFIMATTLVSKQIYYALHKDMGFKKDGIVYLSTPMKLMTTNKQQVFLDQVRQLPQIAMISIGGQPPSSGGEISTVAIFNNGKQEIKTDLQQKWGDANYLKVYHLKLLAGNNLPDQDSSSALLINSAYAKILGFRDPSDAIGKRILMFSKLREIAGVVADFHQKSIRTAIKPIAIMHPREKKFWNRTFHIALKPQTADGNEWQTAIAGLQIAWKNVYPNDDFEYHFFDESIRQFYETEQHTSTLLSWATGLSIFISCLGMLGLVIYTTSQRTKEIGVRKVLGASVTQIVTLLSTELIWLIGLAFVLVSPIAYYVMYKWMENFADRTSISWWIFAVSGGVMVVATLVTLSFQTIKAAVANPVKSLRSE